MATQDNNPGLLSKVARFVRNPTKDWADLGKAEIVQDSELGKEALKLMIERKRHNDSVRKREFNQLRKLRQASPAAKAELVQAASSFRTSSGDVDADTHERATTLKKIDEIEAQMSRQWWKGRSGVVPDLLAASRGITPTPGLPQSLARDGADAFPPTQPSHLLSSGEDMTTQMGSVMGREPLPNKSGGWPVSPASSEFEMSARSTFSASKMVSMDMGQSLADPELEEAAIRYANGDDAGAEAALRSALQALDAKPEAADGWAAALLDMYRSTGQQASFEHMALEYAQRFGRSAPAWSMLQQFERKPARPSPPSSGWLDASATLQWDSPIELDAAAIASLHGMVRSEAVTYCLNWASVQRMSAAAAQSLAELFARWCDMPLAFRFEGVPSLDRLLRMQTPSGDRSVAPYFWRLRLDTLRLLRMQDDYELAALEFCVTFEVSPPPWRDPLGWRVYGSHTGVPAMHEQTVSSMLDNTSAVAFVDVAEQAQPRQFALSGDVVGDVADIVARWQLAVGEVEGGVWVVSCTQLIRVDFSAAGGLLNWVAHIQAEGGRVEFHDVPRLVAAFFNLIGINESAQVIARIN